jgi:predicted SAM-dependent methyltransferase
MVPEALPNFIDMKNLQLCAGGNALPDFENHDMDVDITKPFPWPDNTWDFVFCEHGAEHQNSHQFLRFCDECFRVLNRGGKIRLCMPVIDRLSSAHARDIILGHGHEATYSTDLIIRILELVGFVQVKETGRAVTDHHWRVITEAKDDLETARIEGIKP